MLQTDIGEGCRAMGLALEPMAIDRLAAFVELLQKWNRVYNLTAVRDARQMVTRHILDSLSVLPWLSGRRLLDVGTGAGLPGVPLAVVQPSLAVTLLDTSAKKLRFVRQAVAELGLDNAEVVQSRMQQYRPAQAFDMVISRAVADIGELYADTVRLVRPGGRFLFMKGQYPQAELDAFEAPATLHVEHLQVPSLGAQRHLVWFDKQREPGTEQQ